MSERHIKLCQWATGKPEWRRDPSKFFLQDDVEACQEAHPPELLLAMHEALAASQAMFKEMEDAVGIPTSGGALVERFTIPSKMIGLREAVARYEELTNAG